MAKIELTSVLSQKSSRPPITDAPIDKRIKEVPISGNKQGVSAPTAGNVAPSEGNMAPSAGNNMTSLKPVGIPCVNAPVATNKFEAIVVGKRQGVNAPVGKPNIKIGHRA